MSATLQTRQLDFAAPPFVQILYRRALTIGIVFAILTVIGFAITPAATLRSWMIGFMLCLGLTLGPLGFLMLWHVTGGRWGVPIRRILEAATRTIPLVTIYFLPILFGAKVLYAWARSIPAEDHHLQEIHERWLNLGGFTIRAIIYFAVWWTLILVLNRWSADQDKPHETRYLDKLAAVSAIGVILYFGTMTFASIDWVMSLLPGWNSTIYALAVVVGQGLTALCLCAIVSRYMVEYTPVQPLLSRNEFHDMGKLMFTFVMLWGYMNFSQWLISWAGNLPEEIHWYLLRLRGGWENVAVFLAVFHFCVPFAILLSSGLKQSPRKLALVATWLFFMRYVDLYWNIAPAHYPDHWHYGWQDAVVPIAMVSLWVAFFAFNLKSRPVIALHDPRTEIALAEAEEHHHE
ncbi:MAG TPA: hypothetical protein VEG30_07815 [Terriglobales bacterium]|nr:hypothetical protein [Terriglobales bacterium]